MANLEPMPISSLPEGSIQDGDKMIIYRDSNGKAYQSDASSMESVAELKEEVDKLSADLTDKEDKGFYWNSSNSTDDFFADISSMSMGDIRFIAVASSDIASLLTKGETSSSLKGFIYKSSATLFDYFADSYRGGVLYAGRIESNNITYVYKYSGTSVS